MENGSLESVLVKKTAEDQFNNDVELVYDITGWLKTLDDYLTNSKDPAASWLDPYRHKSFEERHIRILFQNCKTLELTGICGGGEIKFGGRKQEDPKYRYQDRNPGQDIIIDRPYTCFYMNTLDSIVVYFNEDECRISAELF